MHQWNKDSNIIKLLRKTTLKRNKVCALILLKIKQKLYEISDHEVIDNIISWCINTIDSIQDVLLTKIYYAYWNFLDRIFWLNKDTNKI